LQHAVQRPHSRFAGVAAPAGCAPDLSGITAPQHFLYFFPLPHGQGSFLAVAICLPGVARSSNRTAARRLRL